MIRYYSGNLDFPKNGGLKNLQEIFRTKKIGGITRQEMCNAIPVVEDRVPCVYLIIYLQ